MDGADFKDAVSAAYAEVIHWQRNLFLTPSGKAGESFVSELARLFRAYGESSALESVALTAAMIMPALLLQKPYASSKTRDHVACLQRRLISWQEGDIDSLVREGCTIQRRIRQTSSHIDEAQRTARILTRLMFRGKVKAAMQILSTEGKGTSLPLDSIVSTSVHDELTKKHPHQVNLHTQVPWSNQVKKSQMSTRSYLSVSMADSESVLLVDATNAFYTLNRQAALLNIHSLCPPLAIILTNTYRRDIQLFIDGNTLPSCEGTTQGDPLAMAMYAIGIIPLINQL